MKEVKKALNVYIKILVVIILSTIIVAFSHFYKAENCKKWYNEFQNYKTEKDLKQQEIQLQHEKNLTVQYEHTRAELKRIY